MEEVLQWGTRVSVRYSLSVERGSDLPWPEDVQSAFYCRVLLRVTQSL